jgi:hypothetical protein
MTRRSSLLGSWLPAFFTGSLLLCSWIAEPQELTPAAYTPAPKDINFATIVASYSGGEVTFDPSLPVEDVTADIYMSSLGYARTFGLAGRSANIAVALPYVVGDLEGLYLGDFTTAHRSGIGDMGARLSVNLLGAPAMTMKEFAGYRAKTLVGVSLAVFGPTGQYDPSKAINIGTNRWTFKPEIGVVRVVGKWAFDAYLGGKFFTTNTNFFGGATRVQDPILLTQVHVRRAFGPRLWAAFDANYWWGGQTTVNGVESDDLQSNSRVGLTVATRFGRNHTLRFAYSRGAFTRIGGDFDSMGFSYGFSWIRLRPKAPPPDMTKISRENDDR